MRNIAGLALFFITHTAFGQNVVVNGGFEQGTSGWEEQANGHVRAEGRIDRTERHSGKASFHITNASPFAAQVYYRIYRWQAVKPKTKYLIGAWSKGTGVGKCWIGGGPNWMFRRQFPAGDYDWRWTATEYTTGPDETRFELMILTESPTRDLWVDDVYMAPIDQGPAAQFYEPTVRKGLPAEARFYPALPMAQASQSPVVAVRQKEDPAFGFDARINWSAASLILNLDVHDSTISPIIPGKDLRLSDSIEVGIDMEPEKPKDRFGASCYDLGFAVDNASRVVQCAWYAGGVDAAHWPDLEATGRRTTNGWQMTIHIPWARLRLSSAEPPRVIGVNILANDGPSGGKSRRWVEWTEGMGSGVKRPDRFARLFRADRPDAAAYVLFDAKPLYDRTDLLIGRFVEYAFRSQPAGKVSLICGSNEGKLLFDWGTVPLPPVSDHSIRSFEFLLPLTALKDDGVYRLLARTASASAADVPFVRTSLSVRVADLVRSNETRANSLRRQASDRASNAYVGAALTIADRFIRRAKPDKSGKEQQSIDWSLRQMNEVAALLDDTEKLVAAKSVFDSPSPLGGPVEIQDGVFCTQTTAGKRPFYFGGFGHFGLVREETPLLRAMGYSVIEFEAGPASLSRDNQLDSNGQSSLDAVRRASEERMKVVFLLSPHYFPQWAIDKAPDVVVPGGFNKFDINHPVAREAVGKWIDFIVGKTKDEPSILSYDLMNEPSYNQSGRTRCSRPLWVRWLRERHKAIESLNALYGTKHPAFEQVPVPNDEYPSAVGDRRAYYDWVIFNHENFADWFRFMHNRVKRASPRAFTQAKLFDVHLFWAGVDPELICEVTDIAGNDCWSLWPGGEYAYSWLTMEFYYDLLHSFRGQPVANTENHILPDGGSAGDACPASHTYAVYWQGALHHQGAQVTWLWENQGDPMFEGNISLRPANVYAGAKAMLDLNRLAEEVTAINQAKPEVALLYSPTSTFWEKDFEETSKEIYTALNFMGLKITFVSERQLAAGKNPPADYVILPHATHVLDSTVAALNRFVEKGGHLILVGPDNLAYDEYHRSRSLPSALAKRSPTPVKNLPGVLKTLPRMTLLNADTRRPAWGVEFRVVAYQDQYLVPLTNLLSKPQIVVLPVKGKVTDLITGNVLDPAGITLAPMECMLLRCPR